MNRSFLRRLERLENRRVHNNPCIGFEFFELTPQGTLMRSPEFEHRPGNPTLRLIIVQAAGGKPLGWSKYNKAAPRA